MKVQSMGVIGAGQMGSGIAQVAAASGIHVILNDINRSFAERGFQKIQKNLTRDVEKGRISPEIRDEIQSSITISADLNDLASVDIAIEAAIESEQIKLKLFKALDVICPEHAILASNTSSIPIGRIAAATARPGKVIGMHFMNPVPVIKLVEVIRGMATCEETYQTVWELSKTLGKTPAAANDYPGFIANRILLPMINEAVFTLYHGVGSKEAIDTVMKLGMNHPMGPLALADLIGLDTCLAIMETLFDGFGDPKYRPCPLLRKYVEAGWLGRKSGRGFYQYDESF